MSRIHFSLCWFTLVLGLYVVVACRPTVDADATRVRHDDGTATAEIEVLPFSGQYSVIADIANLRAGPGVEYEQVGTLGKGDVVTLDGIRATGDWYRTTMGAWIVASFVVPADEAATVTNTPALERTRTSTPSATPLPTPTPGVTPVPTMTDCPGPPSGWVRYTIRAGDTLPWLAIHTDSSAAELREANCLVNNLIFAGHKLFVPRLPPTRAPIPTQTPTSTNTSFESPLAGTSPRPLAGTPTRTASPELTHTPTSTLSPADTPTPTNTASVGHAPPTPTPTPIPPDTPTPTNAPVDTPTPTDTPTEESVDTPEPTETSTATLEPTSTQLP